MAGMAQWGSRSVDIFEKVEQVGEGTYDARTKPWRYCNLYHMTCISAKRAHKAEEE